MNHPERSFIAPVALLAAATGARTTVGVAAVGQTRSAPLATVTALLALLELLADKLPNIRNRTDPAAIAGRMAAGALIGAAVSEAAGRDRLPAALAGATFAFVGAHLSFRFRRSLMRHLPPLTAAVVEDAVVIALARTGERFLESGSGAAAGREAT
jgi:uncharacterized membrane protein